MASPKNSPSLLKKESKTLSASKASSKTLAATDTQEPSKETTKSNLIKTPIPSAAQKKSSVCCKGSTDCNTHDLEETDPGFSLKKGPKTRIIITYDVGFGNTITIRGKGAGLNWDLGLSLKNTKTDQWVWETETPFTTAEFKVLINDKHYEIGENHTLRCGASILYTPRF